MSKDADIEVLIYQDGTFKITFPGGELHRFDVSGMRPDQKMEKIRWSILNRGYVFTEKIEKSVRKQLGLQRPIFRSKRGVSI